MPVDYSIPNYLHPVDTVSPAVQGMQMGVQIAEQRNRLAQQAQQAQMELQVRQQAQQQAALRQQQEIEMQKQRIQVMQGLKNAQLEEAQQRINLNVQKAAARVQAQQEYQAALDAGQDPAKALLQLGPRLGISMTGLGQLYRSTQPKQQMGGPTQITVGGEDFLQAPLPNGSFKYQQIRHPKSAAQMPDSIQSVPVYYPGTKDQVPGVIGIPGVNGGVTVRNVPNRQVGIAQATIKRLEADPIMGTYLTSDRAPVQGKKQSDADFAKQMQSYKKAKDMYDKAQAVLEGAMNGTLPGGSVSAAPWADGTPLTHKDGSKWVVRDGRAVQVQPQQSLTVSPPHDEGLYPSPPDEEEQQSPDYEEDDWNNP